jgi:hypothetical protein
MDLAAKLQRKGGQRLETVLPPQCVTSDLNEITPTGDSVQEPALIVFVGGRSTPEESEQR